MLMRYCTLGDLIETGRLQKGDFIDYQPDANEYRTDSRNTGCESQVLRNEIEFSWQVRILDKDKLILWPIENLVEDIWLWGSRGFLHGPEELNNICQALGSNKKLGVMASCLTIEDMKQCYGIVNEGNVKRYAFYPKGSGVIPGSLIYKNGTGYKKVVMQDKVGYFYENDGGGITKLDCNGNEYRIPLSHKPVFVTETICNNFRINELGDDFWIASKGACFFRDVSSFYLYVANSKCITLGDLIASNASVFGYNYGVRPKISLSSKLLVDVSDNERDGSSPEKAWKLVVDECIENEGKSTKELISDAEDNEYKIIYAEAEGIIEAVLKLEKEVNKFIKEGYEIVGAFKLINKKNNVVCCQQMVKK